MRRATTILFGILLGAIAAGLGVGFVLHQANMDRERLAAQVDATAEAARETRQQDKQAIDAANQQLANANAEVAKAQDLIQALKAEKELLAQATKLTPAVPRLTRDWTDVVAIDLGVSLKQPAFSTVETNTTQVLTLATTQNQQMTQWFSVMPYSAAGEQDLLAALATSTSVAYVVDGRLLSGVTGIAASDQRTTVFVLQARSDDGHPTHLIWMRQPTLTTDTATLLSVLASMRFGT